jgi:hypothetical protein
MEEPSVCLASECGTQKQSIVMKEENESFKNPKFTLIATGIT